MASTIKNKWNSQFVSKKFKNKHRKQSQKYFTKCDKKLQKKRVRNTNRNSIQTIMNNSKDINNVKYINTRQRTPKYCSIINKNKETNQISFRKKKINYNSNVLKILN